MFDNYTGGGIDTNTLNSSDSETNEAAKILTSITARFMKESIDHTKLHLIAFAASSVSAFSDCRGFQAMPPLELC